MNEQHSAGSTEPLDLQRLRDIGRSAPGCLTTETGIVWHPANELLGAAQKIERLQAALELVWGIHVGKEMHLGWERPSGIAQHCIPCICAAALGRGMDSDCVTTEDFTREIAKLKESKS